MGIDTDKAGEQELHIFTVGHDSSKDKLIQYKMLTDGLPVKMNLDTMAEVPEVTDKSLFSH